MKLTVIDKIVKQIHQATGELDLMNEFYMEN